jgi:hypothetical protein
MNSEFGKDVEGNGRGLIYGIITEFAVRTEEKHRKHQST